MRGTVLAVIDALKASVGQGAQTDERGRLARRGVVVHRTPLPKVPTGIPGAVDCRVDVLKHPAGLLDLGAVVGVGIGVALEERVRIGRLGNGLGLDDDDLALKGAFGRLLAVGEIEEGQLAGHTLLAARCGEHEEGAHG